MMKNPKYLTWVVLFAVVAVLFASNVVSHASDGKGLKPVEQRCPLAQQK